MEKDKYKYLNTLRLTRWAKTRIQAIGQCGGNGTSITRRFKVATHRTLPGGSGSKFNGVGGTTYCERRASKRRGRLGRARNSLNRAACTRAFIGKPRCAIEE
jgi:hypothetical protein